MNKPLFGAVSGSKRKAPTTKTIAEAVEDFLKTKRGESIVDMAHYEGLFSRKFLPWCNELGLHHSQRLAIVAPKHVIDEGSAADRGVKSSDNLAQ